jgi:hypothetical protein
MSSALLLVEFCDDLKFRASLAAAIFGLHPTTSFHAIVPIRQGLEWYYGKGLSDQLNALLAEFLKEEPYRSSQGSTGFGGPGRRGPSHRGKRRALCLKARALSGEGITRPDRGGTASEKNEELPEEVNIEEIIIRVKSRRGLAALPHWRDDRSRWSSRLHHQGRDALDWRTIGRVANLRNS